MKQTKAQALEEYLADAPLELRKFMRESYEELPKLYKEGYEVTLMIHRPGLFNEYVDVSDLDSLKGLLIEAKNSIKQHGRGGTVSLSKFWENQWDGQITSAKLF